LEIDCSAAVADFQAAVKVERAHLNTGDISKQEVRKSSREKTLGGVMAGWPGGAGARTKKAWLR
jgi:hypothetical protein